MLLITCLYLWSEFFPWIYLGPVYDFVLRIELFFRLAVIVDIVLAYLVIDFWGMGCGPCRSEIQASKDVRSKIAKRDDVKLVYIADENIAGGSESYRKYVAEWLDGEETMCVSDVTFNAMEELFEFTAIPHKVIITPEGLVVDDALSVSMHDFDNSFENVKKRLNK